MSPDDFRQMLVIIGIVIALWALVSPILLMLTLYAIGYQHDYELQEPQWTIPGLMEWFFVPKGNDHETKTPQSIWRYQRGYAEATPLPIPASNQDLQLEDEVFQVPKRMAATYDAWPRW